MSWRRRARAAAALGAAGALCALLVWPPSPHTQVEQRVSAGASPIREAPPCDMSSCFNYSRCPLGAGLTLHFYEPDLVERLLGYRIDEFIKNTFIDLFQSSPYVTTEPSSACVYVVLIGEPASTDENDFSDEWKLNESALKMLPYWGKHGSNHLLWQAGRGGAAPAAAGRALRAGSALRRPRRGFDLVAPPALGPADGDVWHLSEPIVPARRRYLLSFQGMRASGALGALGALSAAQEADMLLQWRCEPAGGRLLPPGEWALCGSEASRRAVLAQSMFTLVPADDGGGGGVRLLEALAAGAVPVVLYDAELNLPFDEVVEWSRAALLVPAPRAGELPALLRAVPAADLLAVRRHGRLLWERYLSSVVAGAETLLGALRTRLQLPPPPAPAARAAPAFGDSYTPPPPDTTTTVSSEDSEDEFLGPIDPPYPSPAYTRNLTLTLFHRYAMWNEWLEPWAQFPAVPWEGAAPVEARPQDATNTHALGGDYPYEQFTAVVLTYERPALLAATIAALRHMPYLNKIVVVWNGESDPARLRWEAGGAGGARVQVLRARNNSLNSRFLPYDLIETDAVLSLDDDALVRNDEIMLAFRVWRQHRDQLVGLPARTHVWDGRSFVYSTYPSCSVSMVLTGAAFLHRYYLSAYSRVLPAAVRAFVARRRNCEDIAMNYLVAHISRKPPIKVTGRRQFPHSPGPALSLRARHHEERTECMHFFTKVFGYTPLLVSQYRADSVLFGAGLPDQHMCYKYV